MGEAKTDEREPERPTAMRDVVEGPVGSASIQIPEEPHDPSLVVDGWPRVEVDADDGERASR